MGTRADFYVGRGADAEWLGSIAWDGYPSGIDGVNGAGVLGATTEQAFRHYVARFLAERDDGTLPEQGWPWPWETSSTTDYAYAFDGTQVYGSCGGAWWPALHEPEDHDELQGPPAVFPDMSARKNVQFGGKRSGLIVVSAPKEPDR